MTNLSRGSENWSTYKVRLTSRFLVNEVTDSARRKAALIAVLGGKTVGLLVSFYTPDATVDMS